MVLFVPKVFYLSVICCRFIVNCFICITQFGFCVIYVLFISKNIKQVSYERSLCKLTQCNWMVKSTQLLPKTVVVPQLRVIKKWLLLILKPLSEAIFSTIAFVYSRLLSTIHSMSCLFKCMKQAYCFYWYRSHWWSAWNISHRFPRLQMFSRSSVSCCILRLM